MRVLAALSVFAFALVACGDDESATPTTTAPATTPSDPGSPEPGAAPDPTLSMPAGAPDPPGTAGAGAVPAAAPDPMPEHDEVVRAFEARLGNLEPARPWPMPEDCSMGCAYQNDARLVLVTALGVEGDGTPTHFEIRTEGGEASVRSLGALSVGTPEAWDAFHMEEGPPPWLRALRAAMPELPASRPATDLVAAVALESFSLSEYAPLVSLGGSFEGRWLLWYEAPLAHHLYLVHGAEHTVRLVAAIPHHATGCDGEFATSACAGPIGIEHVYEVPGEPALVVVLYHPEPGDGGDRHSTLRVPLDDASALRPDAAQRQAEIAASLDAPGARARPFAMETAPEAPCAAGCAVFRADAFGWAFPEELVDGRSEQYAVRRRDGTFVSPLLPLASAVQTLTDELGEGAESSREIIARSVVAAWNGFTFSPLVELGPPHMGRRLVVEAVDGETVVFFQWADARAEVARLPRDGTRGGPWGIDRVLAPIGAGYPLVIVFAQPLGHGASGVRHRVAIRTIERPPLEPATEPR